MLKQYEYNGRTFQWEEGLQPKGAVEVAAKKAEPEKKVREPRNKARAPKKKGA